jgi:DnaJ-domain-containing protein 1
MADSWRSQAIPVVEESWRTKAVPEQPYSPKFIGPSPDGAINRTPQEELLSTTSVGRVLDAFGEGASEGWGASPLGLSPESEKWLRDHKVFDPVQANWLMPTQAFNEGLIRPAAAGLDAALRLFPAAAGAVGHGAGALINEIFPQDTGHIVGDEATKMRAHVERGKSIGRDMAEFLEIAGYVAGGEATYMGTAINKPKVSKAKQSLSEVVEEPVKPKDVTDLPVAPGAEAPKPTLKPRDTVYVEAGVDVKRQEPVLINPTQADVGKLMRDSDFGVRVMMDKKTGDVMVWDGDAALHDDIAAALSMDRSNVNEWVIPKGIPLGEQWPKIIGARSDLSKSRGKTLMREMAAASAKPEQLAQPIPPIPAGAPPKFVTPSGGVDTAKIGELKDVYSTIEELSQSYQAAPLATRGTVTWADTEALAQVAGVTPDVLMKRGIGEAWNAHQLDAATDLLKQTARELQEASRKARATGSDADTLAAVEAWNKAALVNEAVTGLKTEAGRALNILKKHKQEVQEVDSLSRALESLGGKASWDEIMDALKKMDNEGDPAKINKFIHDIHKPGAEDMVLEYLYNAMLSNPVTHAANLIGNSLMTFWDIGETFVAGAAGTTRQALGSRSALAGDRAYMGEAGAKLWGLLQGAPEGLRLALRAIQEGKPQTVNKMETIRYRKVKTPDGKTVKVPVNIEQAIPNLPFDLVYNKKGEIIQEAGGSTVGLGSIIRTPTTLLMAADEVFYAMGYRAALNAEAYRKAAKKGLKGQDFADEVAKLVQNPTKKMIEKARDHGHYITFTTELGKTGKSIQGLLAKHPTAKFIVAPFFRTPVNLLKRVHERTINPLTPFSTELIETLAGKNGKADRDLAFSRIALGMGAVGAVFTLAGMGKITGQGPKDPAERADWLRFNQPYSFKAGDRWVSYARFDPFSTLFGIAADLYEIREKIDVSDAADIGTLVAYSVSQNLLNKTWLKGIVDPVEAFVVDPERFMPGYMQSLATRTIPAGVGQLARMDDPYLRDARSLIDALKVKTPGKSQEVFPKRDVFGRPIKREGAVGPDILSPVFKMTPSTDPVDIAMHESKFYPAMPQRKIRGVELTQKQYEDYVLISGRLLYLSFKQLVTTPGWNSIPEGIRVEMLDRKLRSTREQASTLMLMQNQDLLIKSMQQKYKHMTGEK